MNIKLDDGATRPTRAHYRDAGYDLYSRKTRIIWGKRAKLFDTGVHFQIPAGFAGLLVSKSGLNVRRGITSTGLIDSGYTGAVCVKLYNHSWKPYIVRKGDKISQITFVTIFTPWLKEVDDLEASERGNNGFGSSGR